MCDGMSPNAMFSNGSEHVSENMTKHAVWMSQNVQKRQATEHFSCGANQWCATVVTHVAKRYFFQWSGAGVAGSDVP
tara:strand:+ start:365 stop:595 length:231 start_codon:yes stop_codon:yes gene_type:complete